MPPNALQETRYADRKYISFKDDKGYGFIRPEDGKNSTTNIISSQQPKGLKQ